MVETTIRAVPAATPTLTNTIYINPLAKRLGDAYKDGFSIESTSQRTFLEILGLLGMGRKSQKVQVRDLKFHPMPAREEVEEAFKDNTALQLAARDSIKNDTRIFVEYEGRPIMLRATAIPSFLDRLRISGDVLSVIPKEMLAKHLNDYAQFTSGTALLIENNGKGEALLGQKYKLTPAEEIMDEAAQFFQGADFEKGLYSHSFVSATWRLGETKVQIPFDEDGNDLVFDQTVTVSTSDNGRKAISVVPMMQLKGDSMGLSYCLPLRMEHNGKSGIEEFHKMLELIDKRFDDTSLFIKQLLDIDLQYPANVLLAMFKFLKIPGKYGASVYENKKIMWSVQTHTAYEVYSALSEVLSLILGESQSEQSLAEYRERFSRALKFDFEAYDLPGDYGYNDRFIGQKAV